MPPPKAKGQGITSSTFFDLAAEVERQKEDVNKSKAISGSGIAEPIAGGVKRPEKKTSIWQRSNKGVANRQIRDFQLEAISKPTLERAQAVLERKADLYNDLKRGRAGGLTERQYESLLVDFDAKAGQSSDSESDLEDPLAGSKTLDSDEMVEYEDEYGRTRTVKRSGMPRHLISQQRQQQDRLDSILDDDVPVIHGDVGYFPTFEHTQEKVEAILEAAKEGDPATYYDSTKEVRDKGAGYYNFSADTETRARQQVELGAVREETMRAREDSGAIDAPSVAGPSQSVTSRALGNRKLQLEERKRRLEEKRREHDVKRRKKDPPESGRSPATSSFSTANSIAIDDADRFLRDLQDDLKGQ